jgi:ectoine hydroxylase-related dioxygenase (phytanoyl-CoA dioxygenase family)
MPLTDSDRRHLDERGYLVLPDFMGAALLGRLRHRVAELFDAEGAAAGSEFKLEPGSRRLANLADKGDVFREIIALPCLLEHIRHVLGPDIKLSSLHARAALPNGGAQPLHADMSAIADERGNWVCNTIWMLDDYTRDNGALRIVPGSHHFRRLPQHVLPNPRADHPEQVLVTGPSGSVVVVNSHAWHGGTANRTDHPRTAVHAFYCRRDKPQQQYQKHLLRAETQQALPSQLRDLLALDDPVNDEVSGEVAVRSGFMK